MSEEKEEYPETLGFGQFLRKHLDGYFLADIAQLRPERILKFTFETKEDRKHLYIEFIGKGNAILCNKHDIILNALEHHDFSTRSIRPKLKYTYPVMNVNLFEVSDKELIDLLKNSRKESLVISLATELGLGGIYSEEICLLSSIDKNLNPKNINEKQIHLIISSIKKITNAKITAMAVFDENGNVIDVIPFDMEFYYDKKYKKQEFKAFNEAAAFFYSQFKELKESAADKKIKELQRIAETQRQTIGQLRKEEHELRQKGEAIYQNYQLVKEVLDELNKASKKYSWKEIKEKLRGHNTIKEVNEKERKVLVEI